MRADARQTDQRRTMCDDKFTDAGLEACAVGVEELDPTSELAEREPGLLLNQVWVGVTELAGVHHPDGGIDPSDRRG